MGYTTNFDGEFKLSRPLSSGELTVLRRLHDERHGGDIHSDPNFPGFYCQWEPNDDGTAIRWDGGEKFYEYVDWMNLIIERYLSPWGITATGTVHYQGESVRDHGNLVIENGRCTAVAYRRRPQTISGDVIDDLMEYVDELEEMDGRIGVGEVTDRLKQILYGDES